MIGAIAGTAKPIQNLRSVTMSIINKFSSSTAMFAPLIEETTRNSFEQWGQRTVPEKFTGTAMFLLQERQVTFTFSSAISGFVDDISTRPTQN